MRGAKKVLIFAVTAALIGSGLYYASRDRAETGNQSGTAMHEVIGTSIEGREIRAYRFGSGERVLVFVGAIHGGYEWNTALLSYELIDHLSARPEVVPENVTVVIIPVANPDGLHRVVGTTEQFDPARAPQFTYAADAPPEAAAGRFNARGVDLNRNFDCQWRAEAVWGNRAVSGGTAPFSEPESRALRNFLLPASPEAVVFFHSAGAGVYGASCGNEAAPAGTAALLTAYSGASGHRRYDAFEDYTVTGAAENWLASVGIPAVTVELAAHNVIEWERNRAGIEAVLTLYK